MNMFTADEARAETHKVQNDSRVFLSNLIKKTCELGKREIVLSIHDISEDNDTYINDRLREYGYEVHYDAEHEVYIICW